MGAKNSTTGNAESSPVPISSSVSSHRQPVRSPIPAPWPADARSSTSTSELFLKVKQSLNDKHFLHIGNVSPSEKELNEILNLLLTEAKTNPLFCADFCVYFCKQLHVLNDGTKFKDLLRGKCLLECERRLDDEIQNHIHELLSTRTGYESYSLKQYKDDVTRKVKTQFLATLRFISESVISNLLPQDTLIEVIHKLPQSDPVFYIECNCCLLELSRVASPLDALTTQKLASHLQKLHKLSADLSLDQELKRSLEFLLKRFLACHQRTDNVSLQVGYDSMKTKNPNACSNTGTITKPKANISNDTHLNVNVGLGYVEYESKSTTDKEKDIYEFLKPVDRGVESQHRPLGQTHYGPPPTGPFRLSRAEPGLLSKPRNSWLQHPLSSPLPVDTNMHANQKSSNLPKKPAAKGNNLSESMKSNSNLNVDVLNNLLPIYNINGKKIVSLSNKCVAACTDNIVLLDCLTALSIIHKLFINFPVKVCFPDLKHFSETLPDSMKRVVDHYGGSSGSCLENMQSFIALFPSVLQQNNNAIKSCDGGFYHLMTSINNVLRLVISDVLKERKGNIVNTCEYLNGGFFITHLPFEGKLTPILLRNFLDKYQNQMPFNNKEDALKVVTKSKEKGQVISSKAKQNGEAQEVASKIGHVSKEEKKVSVASQISKKELLKSTEDIAAKAGRLPVCGGSSQNLDMKGCGLGFYVGEVIDASHHGATIWLYASHRRHGNFNTIVFASKNSIYKKFGACLSSFLEEGDIISFYLEVKFFNSGPVICLARNIHSCVQEPVRQPFKKCAARSSIKKIAEALKLNHKTVFWNCSGIVVAVESDFGTIVCPKSREVPYNLLVVVRPEDNPWIVGRSDQAELDNVLSCGDRVVCDAEIAKNAQGQLIWLARCVRKCDTKPIEEDLEQVLRSALLGNWKFQSQLNEFVEDIAEDMDHMIQNLKNPFWDIDRKVPGGNVMWKLVGEIGNNKHIYLRASSGEIISVKISNECWNPDLINLNQIGISVVFCAQYAKGKYQWYAKCVQKCNETEVPVSDLPSTAYSVEETNAAERNGGFSSLVKHNHLRRSVGCQTSSSGTVFSYNVI